MKSKSDNNQVATKKDIQLLKGDIKSLEGDIKALERKLKGGIALVRLDVKDAFEKHEEKHKEYRDEILTKMDEVVGKLQKKEEEDTAGADLIQELDDKVADHEKRIVNLESAA